LGWLWLAVAGGSFAVALSRTRDFSWSFEGIALLFVGVVFIGAAFALWHFRARFAPTDLWPFVWTIVLSSPLPAVLFYFLLGHVSWAAAALIAVLLSWGISLAPMYRPKVRRPDAAGRP